MIRRNVIYASVRGFTLVELLICIGIMVIMTGTLLWRYPESTMKMNLATKTHQLSGLVREAQIRGSSVDSVNGSVGGYGIFIDSATSSQVILFKDNVEDGLVSSSGLGIGDGLYDMWPVQEAKSITKLLPNYSFKKLCITNPSDPTKFLCNDNNTPPIITLTVSFTRPSTSADIYINGSSASSFSSACIQLYSPKSPEIGHIRSVQVYHSGMVTTSVTPCD
jgi:prepilin-type N-terminal cleavage/methylation domain-containing protein